MPEYNYYVDIKKTGTGTDTKITGNLTYTFCKYDTKSDYLPFPTEEKVTLEFNPLTILGDLRNREKPYEYPNERFNIDRSWKYLLGSYEYEYGFGEPLYIGDDAQYLKFVSKLDRIMRNNECTTLEDFGKIQKQNNLNLDCKILVEKENIMYKLLQLKQRYAPKTIYVPLEYKFGEINEELEKNVYMNKNHKLSYHCHTMADVIFSILHFIVIHEYEFKTCSLCQKRYAKIPNHGQGKYCPRNSPLGSLPNDDKLIKKFEKLSCQESMKKFHEIMRNMKKNKLRYVQNNEQENIFISKFDEKNDIIKEIPTVENLIGFYTFIKQYII